MDRDLFKGLPEFLEVARQKSFRKAAERLGVSAVAVGTTIRQMEARLGTPLFHRTTRRVDLTAAGQLLVARGEPLSGEMAETLVQIQELRTDVSGLLRICVQRLALTVVLDRALVDFAERYPRVAVQVDEREGRTDLLADGFDMGIRLGEYIEADMVAVRIDRPVDWRVVGTRDYFERHGRPAVPTDILRHTCIRRRWPGQQQHYRWEFEINRRPVIVDPPGRLTVASFATAKQLVRAGQGLCYLTVEMIEDLSRTTDLEVVLERYMPPPNFLHAYYSPANRDNRRIRAFVDCIRES